MVHPTSTRNKDLERIDIVVGSGSSNPTGIEAGDFNKVYFNAFQPNHGYELFCSDGTASGTMMIADIMVGKHDSNPLYLTYFKGSIYFQADDGYHGREPWKWVPSGSGCNEGRATILLDIRAGSSSSGSAFFTPMVSEHSGSYLYFSASDGTYTVGAESTEGYGGSQIWRTDGTASGTVHAFQKTDNDVYIDKKWVSMDHPQRFHVFENSLYLPASYGIHDVVVPNQGV